MAFDESKIARDDRGRFSSTGTADKSQLTTKTTPGKLSDWAGRGLPRSKATGRPKGTWDPEEAKRGPLAGKLEGGRLDAEKQKTLFDTGKPTLTEGSHFLKRTSGDPLGHEAPEEGEQQQRDRKFSGFLVDQAFKDIAQRFPNVADYLKKNPLSEVQARRAMAATGTIKNVDTGETGTGYSYLPVAGQYTQLPPDKRRLSEVRDPAGTKLHDQGYKPGDLMLNLSPHQPEPEVGHPFKVEPMGKSTLDYVTVPQERLPLAENVSRAEPPWTIGQTGKNAREVALVTTLHELGHHIMYGDAAHDFEKARKGGSDIDDPTVRSALMRANPLNREFARVGSSGDTKGAKVRNFVEKQYEKDFERSTKGNRNLPPPSMYAGTSPAEWFAEAFAAFHVRPDYLKEASPVAYKTVKRVLKMRNMQQPDPVRRGTPPLLSWAGSKRKSEAEVG